MRERLIGAAVDCFVRVGYAATTVAHITEQAGVSHGTFYRYFDNVDDVLRAAVEAPLDDVFRAADRPAGDDATSLEALIGWQQGFLLAYLPHRTLFGVMREAVAADRGHGFSDAWAHHRRRFVEAMERWVAAVEGELGPDPSGLSSTDLAQVLAAMVEQVAHVHLALAPSTPDETTVLELGRAVSVACHRTVVQARPGSGGGDRQT